MKGSNNIFGMKGSFTNFVEQTWHEGHKVFVGIKGFTISWMQKGSEPLLKRLGLKD